MINQTVQKHRQEDQGALFLKEVVTRYNLEKLPEEGQLDILARLGQMIFRSTINVFALELEREEAVRVHMMIDGHGGDLLAALDDIAEEFPQINEILIEQAKQISESFKMLSSQVDVSQLGIDLEA